jgi:GMP synthase-like glutamine amidotransferase
VTKGKQKEIGWYPVKLTDEGSRDWVFEGFEREFEVFQWHGDTFEIPEGATRLATSDIFSNQAFRIGSAYGLQFHLEVTAEMIENWTGVYKEELYSEGINPDKMLEETKIKIPALSRHAQRLYSNFFRRLETGRQS